MNIKMIPSTSVKNKTHIPLAGVAALFLVGSLFLSPVKVFADTVAPSATVSHIGATKTIVINFSEPVQLLTQGSRAVSSFSKNNVAIYALNTSGAHDLSTKAAVAIQSASLVSNTLTVVYTGTLAKSVDTQYVVDALGYSIVDMAGNPILKSSQTFTVARSTPSGAVLGTQAFRFTLLLKQGSTGNEVMELQKVLIANGYSIGVADGKFGPKTKKALSEFQTTNGLKGDGIAGALTRAILNK